MLRARKENYRSERMSYGGLKERFNEWRGDRDGMLREGMSDRES